MAFTIVTTISDSELRTLDTVYQECFAELNELDEDGNFVELLADDGEPITLPQLFKFSIRAGDEMRKRHLERTGEDTNPYDWRAIYHAISSMRQRQYAHFIKVMSATRGAK